MTFDGESVWLRPSIGNWSFPCRSHYWIVRAGQVRWARTWSEEEVRSARAGRAIEDKAGEVALDRSWVSRLSSWLAAWWRRR
jgi:hypothetical protein